MKNEFDKTSDKQIKRGNPNWQKGKSANPKGRPLGTGYITLLEDAIKEVEKEKKKSFFRRVIERAYISDSVLVAVLKKFVPDRQFTQIEEVENPELVMAKARGSFKKKLDLIAERLGDIREDTSKQKSGPVEASKDVDIKLDDITPKVRIEKDIESEEPDKSRKIIVSKGMGYEKYDKIIIK